MSANVFRKLEISPWKSAQTQRKGGIKTMMFVRWGFILYNSVLAVSDFPKHSSILQHSQCRTFKALRRTEYQVYLNRYCVLGLCSEYCSLRLQRIPQDFQYKPWNCDVANTRTCGIPNLWGGGACSNPGTYDRWSICSAAFTLVFSPHAVASGTPQTSRNGEQTSPAVVSQSLSSAQAVGNQREAWTDIHRHGDRRRTSSQADRAYQSL